MSKLATLNGTVVRRQIQLEYQNLPRKQWAGRFQRGVINEISLKLAYLQNCCLVFKLVGWIPQTSISYYCKNIQCPYSASLLHLQKLSEPKNGGLRFLPMQLLPVENIAE